MFALTYWKPRLGGLSMEKKPPSRYVDDMAENLEKFRQNHGKAL